MRRRHRNFFFLEIPHPDSPFQRTACVCRSFAGWRHVGDPEYPSSYRRALRPSCRLFSFGAPFCTGVLEVVAKIPLRVESNLDYTECRGKWGRIARSTQLTGKAAISFKLGPWPDNSDMAQKTDAKRRTRGTVRFF